MLQPASSFDVEHRVWFVMDHVVAYDQARDIALVASSGRRSAGEPTRYFLWSHWLRSANGGRDREQIGSVSASTLTRAIEKANRQLEKKA
jgi:hypothetical protein